MFKVTMTLFFATLISVHADSYDVKFKGITLGEIASLETLKDNYLKATVTNPIAKFFIGKKYYVFHAQEAPKIDDAKFRKDKNMVLFAFLQSTTEKPKHKEYKINEDKKMIIDCDAKACQFQYHKKGKLKGNGIVTFDDNGAFVNLKEEISTVEISRR
ncbi:MAG: hypothetical protein K0U47_11100 [Epsilonproteobacteria bacterium]|nr:hypothetical protein [Campylobacterota bacterium]